MIKHDYTDSNQYWGHSISTTPMDSEGVIHSFIGHGLGIQEGDFIILSIQYNDTCQYMVTKIKYSQDPRDMFHGIMEFSPRTDEEKFNDMVNGIA